MATPIPGRPHTCTAAAGLGSGRCLAGLTVVVCVSLSQHVSLCLSLSVRLAPSSLAPSTRGVSPQRTPEGSSFEEKIFKRYTRKFAKRMSVMNPKTCLHSEVAARRLSRRQERLQKAERAAASLDDEFTRAAVSRYACIRCIVSCESAAATTQTGISFKAAEDAHYQGPDCEWLSCCQA